MRIRELSILFLMVACSKESKKQAATASPIPSTSPATTAQYSVANVCGLLSRAEAEGLLGTALSAEPRASSSEAAKEAPRCLYAGPDSGDVSSFVQIEVYQTTPVSNPAERFAGDRARFKTAFGYEPEALTGVGDEAFFSMSALHVKVPSYYLQLQVVSNDELNKDKSKALASLVLPKLR